MRNWIWSGSAMVFLLAVGMFLGAQHAARYPNSLVGHCARTLFNIWEPRAGPENDLQQAEAVAEVTKSRTDGQRHGKTEVYEPILVSPTEEEPPLAIPRLSPEVVAAIERLRGEEESEAPPRIFDNLNQATRMPYADEEVEVLPAPKTAPMIRDQESAHSTGSGFLFMRTIIWKLAVEKMMDSVNQYGEIKVGNEPSHGQER